jgi:hypothetical protein
VLLRAYARRADAAAVAAQLAAFCAAFGVPHDAGALGAALVAVAAAAEQPATLCDVFARLLAVADVALRGLEPALDLVRVLGTEQGAELLAFLRTADEDLRALINSVEERGDSHLRADTVDDVIKVKRALAAALALQAHSPEAVLGALLPAAAEQGMLARVANCCEHVHGLKRLHDSMADRQGLMRSTVSSIVARGAFRFRSEPGETRCHASVLVTADASERDDARAGVSADLLLEEAELHDMQEFVVLQQHNSRLRREAAAEAHGGGAEEDNDAHASAAADELHDFLTWMDHVRAITEAVTELRVLGCIDYRDFDVQALGGELDALAEDVVQAVATFREELAAQRARCIYLAFFNGPQLWLLSDALLDEAEQAEQAAAAASALLQYVQPDARLPQERMPMPAPEAWLTALGGALDDVFGAVGFDEAAPPSAAAPLPPGIVTIMSCGAGASVTALVGLLAAATDAPPRRCQLLVCEAGTTDEDIASFLLRVAMAPDAPLFRHLPFLACHVERLSEAVHLRLVERLAELQLRHAGGDWRLGLLCDGARRQHLLDEYAGRVLEDCGHASWWPATPDAAAAMLSEAGRRVTVVTSEHPGLGKTAWIAGQQCEHALKNVLLAGNVSREQLVARLLALDLRQGDALRVQLCDARDAAALEGLLYEMTQLRCVYGAAGVAHLAHVARFFLEVANSSAGTVHAAMARLPLLGAFECRECAFDISDVTVGATLHDTPDLHIVCLHLALLEAGTADARGVCGLVPGDKLDFLIANGLQQPAVPLPAARCHALLTKYFVNERHDSPPSYATLTVFIRVLAVQLRRFVTNPSLSCLLEQRSPAGVLGARSGVLLALVAMARDFAAQSVSAAREMQATNVRLTAAEDALEQCIRRMDTIVRWDRADTTLLLLEEDGGVISLRIASVHAAVRRCIEEYTQGAARGDAHSAALEMCDMSTASQEVLLDRLCRMVRTTGVPQLPLVPGYVLTADNLLKMAMIYLRVCSTVPVVIMGETGCGKTSLVHNLRAPWACPASVANSRCWTFTRESVRRKSWPLWSAVRQSRRRRRRRSGARASLRSLMR